MSDPIQADTTNLKATKISLRGRCPDGAPNPIDIHVGNRIRIRRNLLKLSQEKMAGLLGLTFQQVQKYERGLNRIGASRLWDISKILSVDINFFYEDMPAEIAEQSPRMFTCDKLGQNDYTNLPLPTPPENTTEAQELITNYFKIPNRRLAAQIFDLTKSLAKSDSYFFDKKSVFTGQE